MSSSAQSIPSTMWALRKDEEVESYKRIQTDVPQPVGDEVLIKVQSVAICGSDIALYKWNQIAKVIATIPFIPGHECSGVVVKTGPEATLKVGQRIAVENHFFCGDCYQCKHGRGDICQNMGQYGHGKKTPHGGCSQYSIVSSKYCYPLTTDITPDEAVLLEPLGVAHNAMERLQVGGEAVLVIGCGPIGLMAVSVAKSMGATRVIVADIDANRLSLAKDMGADIIVNNGQENLKEIIMRETAGDGIGRICEISGNEVMMNSQFSMLRKGGTVVQVGICKKPLYVENTMTDILFKSLTLHTIHGRKIFHTWIESEKLIAERKVDVLKTVSHRLPMSQYEEAFSALLSGKACKIILDPHD